MASRKAPKRAGKRKPTAYATRARRTASSAKARRPSPLEAARDALRDALDQQAAVSEVLAAIGGAGSDPQPVFDLALAHAGRLCHAIGGLLWLRDGDLFRIAAGWSASGASTQALMDYERQHPVPLDNPGVTGRAYRTGAAAQIPDVTVEPGYNQEQLKYLGAANTTRTLLGVPLLLKDGIVIGALSLAHRTVKPFSKHDLAVVRTFADQAVLALENARLLKETNEALERQTATSEVLKAISDSAFELQPMFEKMLRTAARICRADYGFLYHISDARDLSTIRMVASFNVPDEEVRRNREVVESRTEPYRAVHLDRGPLSVESFRAAAQSLDRVVPIDRSLLANRVFLADATVHVPDIADDPDLPANPAYQRLSIRALLGVPMLRGNDIGGAITLTKTTPGPFDESAIKLVETFADQAMIAIENARLVGEIESASRHKSEFLANMSHELRTPLNAIIGFSDVLDQRLFGELNERQADYARDIATSGRHLLELVNEILDLSKVEAGKMELEPGEFALADTIHGTIGFVRERAAGHQIALTVDVPADLGMVVADERKIRQVLLNLLSNAVKFTPDGGRVAVRALRADGEIHVSVQDTGIGIALEDQPRVFEEFRQVGKTSDRSREGTGLGLTLAKRFIELHGGRIWIDSEVGKGTTFTFALPLGRTAIPT